MNGRRADCLMNIYLIIAISLRMFIARHICKKVPCLNLLRGATVAAYVPSLVVAVLLDTVCTALYCCEVQGKLTDASSPIRLFYKRINEVPDGYRMWLNLRGSQHVHTYPRYRRKT